MEDNAIRAIVIGVSLFVTMLTLTAIITYFNTARTVADEVNKRIDIASSYDRIMNSEDFTDTLTGVEIRSLIYKYAENNAVEINIIVVNEDATETKYININNKYTTNGGWLTRINEDVSIISEEKLDFINPSASYTVEKVKKQDKVTLEIQRDVKE